MSCLLKKPCRRHSMVFPLARPFGGFWFRDLLVWGCLGMSGDIQIYVFCYVLLQMLQHFFQLVSFFWPDDVSKAAFGIKSLHHGCWWCCNLDQNLRAPGACRKTWGTGSVGSKIVSVFQSISASWDFMRFYDISWDFHMLLEPACWTCWMYSSALTVKPKWLALILCGEKRWEIRQTNTAARGRIALLASGSSLIYGSDAWMDQTNEAGFKILKIGDMT